MKPLTREAFPESFAAELLLSFGGSVGSGMSTVCPRPQMRGLPLLAFYSLIAASCSTVFVVDCTAALFAKKSFMAQFSLILDLVLCFSFNQESV